VHSNRTVSIRQVTVSRDVKTKEFRRIDIFRARYDARALSRKLHEAKNKEMKKKGRTAKLVACRH
jgi:hypothetical protein